MKNATSYQKKIKKLLAGLEKSSPAPPENPDAFEVLVRSVLEANATAKLVEKGMAALAEEFVDFNELRVAPPKEIVDCLGRDYPEARRKAMEINQVLNGLFTRMNRLSLDHVAEMTKRDIRRHLGELGLCPYAAACMMLFVFEGHAIPVDENLVDCLAMDGYVDPEADCEDVQGFLERIILQKHGLAAHELFREYVVKSAKALERLHRERAEAKAKAEEEARLQAEAEAKAKAEAEAAEKRKQAEAKRKARKAKAAKKKSSSRSAKARSGKASKKTAKKASASRAAKTPKPARKTARKAKKAKKAKRTKSGK